ncbi:hypothetical protein SSCG_03262 [Streptomyces clavuligerus]|nr:hypothetical protein SSCG_03262 [Streptomyces clavuligerus]
MSEPEHDIRPAHAGVAPVSRAVQRATAGGGRAAVIGHPHDWWRWGWG